MPNPTAWITRATEPKGSYWSRALPMLSELQEARQATDKAVSYTTTSRLKRAEDALLALYAEWLTP